MKLKDILEAMNDLRKVKLQKTVTNIIIGLLISAFIVLAVYTVYYNLNNNKEFFEAPVYTIINIIIALLFAYYLSQRNNDKRKQREIIENTIIKIQKLIYDENIYNITENKLKCRLDNSIKVRKIRNHLQYLKDYSKQFKFSVEIELINDIFKEYNEFVDSVFDSNSLDDKSVKNIRRVLEIIDDKLELIIHILYYK